MRSACPVEKCVADLLVVVASMIGYAIKILSQRVDRRRTMIAEHPYDPSGALTLTTAELDPLPRSPELNEPSLFDLRAQLVARLLDSRRSREPSLPACIFQRLYEIISDPFCLKFSGHRENPLIAVGILLRRSNQTRRLEPALHFCATNSFSRASKTVPSWHHPAPYRPNWRAPFSARPSLRPALPEGIALKVRCAMPPPMSWPASNTGLSASPSASTKRTAQRASVGTVASAGVGSPPDRPKPGRSTATGLKPALARSSYSGTNIRACPLRRGNPMAASRHAPVSKSKAAIRSCATQ
jgi:hypothetical protein